MNQITRFKRRDFLSLCAIAPFSTYSIPPKGFSKQTNSLYEGRRVVTGINAEGKSSILKDGEVPENAPYFEPQKISMSVLWKENQIPVNLRKNSESLEGYTFNLEPPQGGMTAHFITKELKCF